MTTINYNKKQMITAQVTKTQKGFTLIELMVVITIIAILAVIGFSVFSGTQRNARDGRRRSEIDSIAKSIEAARDQSANTYSYASVANWQVDFAAVKPVDPLNTATSGSYCIASSATTTVPPADPSTWTGTACPTVPAAGGGYTAYTAFTDGTATLVTPLAAVKSWKICAKLENNGSFFCKQNLFQ